MCFNNVAYWSSQSIITVLDTVESLIFEPTVHIVPDKCQEYDDKKVGRPNKNIYDAEYHG